MSSSDELHCHTAKFKIDEAGYWRDTMNNPEIFDDDFRFGFHLNACLTCAFSTVDYVFADFLFHHPKNRKYTDPYVWKDWNKDERKEHRQKHPNAKELAKFYQEWTDAKSKLFAEPFVDYFHQKRGLITHTKWEADEFARMGTNLQTGEHKVFERHFSYKAEDQKKFSEKLQLENLSDIADVVSYLGNNDVKIVLEKLIKRMREFIREFEGKNYFS